MKERNNDMTEGRARRERKGRTGVRNERKETKEGAKERNE